MLGKVASKLQNAFAKEKQILDYVLIARNALILDCAWYQGCYVSSIFRKYMIM